MNIKDLFNFKGRFNRKEYIGFAILLNIVVFIIFSNILSIIPVFLTLDGYLPIKTITYPYIVSFLISIYILLVSSIKRFHDLDRPGWFGLLAILPYIGLLTIIFLILYPGTKGDNKFSYNKKENLDEIGKYDRALPYMFILVFFIIVIGITYLLNYYFENRKIDWGEDVVISKCEDDKNLKKELIFFLDKKYGDIYSVTDLCFDNTKDKILFFALPMLKPGYIFRYDKKRNIVDNALEATGGIFSLSSLEKEYSFGYGLSKKVKIGKGKNINISYSNIFIDKEDLEKIGLKDNIKQFCENKSFCKAESYYIFNYIKNTIVFDKECIYTEKINGDKMYIKDCKGSSTNSITQKEIDKFMLNFKTTSNKRFNILRNMLSPGIVCGEIDNCYKYLINNLEKLKNNNLTIDSKKIIGSKILGIVSEYSEMNVKQKIKFKRILVDGLIYRLDVNLKELDIELEKFNNKDKKEENNRVMETFNCLNDLNNTDVEELNKILQSKKSKKEFCEMTYLNLERKGIINIPKYVFKLTNLIDLNLGDNKINYLPKEIGNLKKLKTINLSYNKLSELPKELFSLTDLIGLYLATNDLTSISKDIGNLKRLKILVLYQNGIKILPKSFWQLSDLETLQLHRNKLTFISKDIGRLSNLRWLTLANNKLKTIPGEIGKLSSLNKLNLGYNNISIIPKEIQNLSNLFRLDLEYNKLKIIPSGIGKLSNLESLDLSYNDIEFVPKTFANLKKLKSLSFSGNKKLGELSKSYDSDCIKIKSNKESIKINVCE